MVVLLFTASMAKLTASMASFLCSEDAAIMTLGSLTGTMLQKEEGEKLNPASGVSEAISSGMKAPQGEPETEKTPVIRPPLRIEDLRGAHGHRLRGRNDQFD